MVAFNVAANEWIGVTEHFPPYSYIENNKAAGYATELVQRLASKAELNLQIEVLPWSRAMLKAGSQPNVLIYSMLKTPEREPHYHWIGPIDDMSIYLWQLKENSELATKADKQITYAVSRSLDQLNTRMLQLSFGAQESNVISVETTEQLIGMLTLNRVDRIVLAENIWVKLRQSLGELEAKKLERFDLLVQRELYLAASLQTDIEAVTQLQQKFKTLSKKDSTIALRQYHGLY